VDAVLEGLLSAGEAFGATQAYLCLNAGDEELVAAVEAALEAAVEAAKNRITIDVVPVPASLSWRTKGLCSGCSRVDRQSLTYAFLLRPPAPFGIAGGGPWRPDAGEPGAGRAGLQDAHRVVAGEAHVVEASPSTTLRAVVRDVTGAEPDAASIKAVRFGGATGRFYAGAALDTPVGLESEQGCGVVEVMPAGACGVELTRDATRYLSAESCGACVACREGVRQIADMLDDIVAFRAEADNLEVLDRLVDAVEVVASAAWAGRGGGAP